VFKTKSCAALIYVLLTLRGCAQNYNLNIGAGPGFPLNATSNLAGISYNFVAGGGPNLYPHLKMNVEFMFQGIPPHQSVINQLGVADVKGRLYSLSANLLAGTPIGYGKSAYIVGGGGWYRRTLEAKRTVIQAGSVCSPYWAWWSVQCVNGIFPADTTVGSATSSAAGLNVGGGIAIRLGDSSANFYIEVRYHRAFTRNFDTEVLPLTFGIRF
jgi:hypothetical protein